MLYRAPCFNRAPWPLIFILSNQVRFETVSYVSNSTIDNLPLLLYRIVSKDTTGERCVLHLQETMFSFGKKEVQLKTHSFSVIMIFLIAPSINVFATDSQLSNPTQQPDVPYRLFHTSNIWTFRKLNTQDGRIWIVTFDVDGNSRGTHILNDKSLVKSSKLIPGRFTLYPTSNIYNFMLLDQINGKTWQVQWSFESSQRIIIPIADVSK